jgi:hypothetical protein
MTENQLKKINFNNFNKSNTKKAEKQKNYNMERRMKIYDQELQVIRHFYYFLKSDL